MGLFFYEIKMKCSNCGFNNNLRIKKGVHIRDYLKSSKCKCKNCGCKIEPTITKDGIKQYEYETEWIK